MTENPQYASISTGSSSGSEYKTLYGIVGTFYFGKETDVTGQSADELRRICFTSHTKSDIGNLIKEPIDVGQMFWLAVGCLPAPRSKVYSLDDVNSITVQEEPHARSAPVSPVIRFSAGRDDDSDSEEETRHHRRQRKWNQIPIFPNTYVVPSPTYSSTTHYSYCDRRAFQFSPINDRAEALTESLQVSILMTRSSRSTHWRRRS